MSQRIAIISVNPHKFSETFIHSQIEHLAFDICLYSGAYLPQLISLDRGIHFQDLKSGLWKKKSDSEKLASSLKKQKINLVLAQYGPSGVELMPICQKLKIPLVVHFHGYDAFRDDILGTYGKHYLEMFEYAQAIIAVSEDMKWQLIKLACPETKIKLIPYGVDTQLFAPKSVAKKGLISCGRFVEKKGILHSLKAFKRLLETHPNENLKLIGDGPLKEEIESFILANNLSQNISLTGVLKPGEVAKALQESKVFLQHSITTEDNDQEGTPLSILEAMSCGLPVIATKHAGIKQLIQDGKNGYLVEEKDEIGMSEKMKQVLSSESQLNIMGEFARKTVLDQYSLERYIQDLSDLIHACLD